MHTTKLVEVVKTYTYVAPLRTTDNDPNDVA
jgi:hypothetical protein